MRRWWRRAIMGHMPKKVRMRLRRGSKMRRVKIRKFLIQEKDEQNYVPKYSE